MKKNLLFRNGFVAMAVLLATFSAYTNQNQAPSNRNGSPASSGNTCAVSGCHSGPMQTDQVLTITSDIPANGFAENTDYTITVTGNRGTSAATTSGFEASVESTNGFEGSLSVAGFTTTKLVGVGRFATHNGKQGFSGGASSWSFNWNSGTAPDGTTIYAALNFANNNGAKNGDIVVSQSLPLMKAQSISIDENSFANLKIFPNPASDELNISFSSEGTTRNSVVLYDMQGRLVKDLFEGKVTDEFNSTYSISDLSPGIYILNIQNEKGFKQQRIIVQ